MQKQKENPFVDKFSLLNSQENNEPINWSCSESSDYENDSKNERLCSVSTEVKSRKRKRKKKPPKNISNLEITILDVSRDCKNVSFLQKSPNVTLKREIPSPVLSPILQPIADNYRLKQTIKTEPDSPILSCKVRETRTKADVPLKSPVLALKNTLLKFSPKVKIKLFKANKNDDKIENSKETHVCRQDKVQNISGILCKQSYRHEKEFQNPFEVVSNQKIDLIDYIKISKESAENTEDNNNDSVLEDLPNHVTNIKTDNSNLEDSFENPKTSSLDLVKKVRSYFESHFSSENNSQQSISVSLTPQSSSKTSDDVEIVSFMTQINMDKNTSGTQSILSRNPSLASTETAENNDKSKKIRYKKNGLAYCLSTLLKKQTANLSLWRHERYLADHSNFIVPKEESAVFRIQKSHFKYGCYILETVDINNEKFMIFINSIYVSNSIFSTDVIFKLYEPYKILDFSSDCKLIVNVTKFECVDVKL